MDEQKKPNNQKKDDKKPKGNIWVALLPAIFMTYICSSFVFVSDQFVGLGPDMWSYIGGAIVTLLITAVMVWRVAVQPNESEPKLK